MNRTTSQSDDVIMTLAAPDKQVTLLQVTAVLGLAFFDLVSPITLSHAFLPINRRSDSFIYVGPTLLVGFC